MRAFPPRERDSENKQITDEAEKCIRYSVAIAVPFNSVAIAVPFVKGFSGKCNRYSVAITFPIGREREQTEDRTQAGLRKPPAGQHPAEECTCVYIYSQQAYSYFKTKEFTTHLCCVSDLQLPS